MERTKFENLEYFKTILEELTNLIVEGKLNNGNARITSRDLYGMDKIVVLLLIKMTEMQERIAYQNDDLVRLLKALVDGEKDIDVKSLTNQMTSGVKEQEEDIDTEEILEGLMEVINEEPEEEKPTPKRRTTKKKIVV